jgi:hypothetical protein
MPIGVFELFMFKIEMLPADYGDCLWIEYGDPKDPKRIMVDCGTLQTFKFIKKKVEKIPCQKRRFELLVITHIDTDHIEAALKVLNGRSLGLHFRQIWFNEWKHLSPPDELGAEHGEYAAALIGTKGLILNTSFDGGAVVIPDDGPLPIVKLAGKMRLTLLSPGWEQLADLRPVWRKGLERSGLVPGDHENAFAKFQKKKKYADLLGGPTPSLEDLANLRFKEDTAAANGSSIAFLAEYGGKRCLFGGDAHPSVLASSIDRLLSELGASRLKLDAYKVAHHGSRHNTSVELLKKMDCGKFLFSTNGHKTHHPHRDAVARVILYGTPNRPERKVQLYFNYLSRDNSIWNSPIGTKGLDYESFFHSQNKSGLTLEL